MNTKEKVEIDGVVYEIDNRKASEIFKEYADKVKNDYAKMLKEEFGVNLIVRD